MMTLRLIRAKVETDGNAVYVQRRKRIPHEVVEGSHFDPPVSTVRPFVEEKHVVKLEHPQHDGRNSLGMNMNKVMLLVASTAVRSQP